MLPSSATFWSKHRAEESWTPGQARGDESLEWGGKLPLRNVNGLNLNAQSLPSAYPCMKREVAHRFTFGR